MNATTAPQAQNRIDCLCGCGQSTSERANYRPGHDAAHVSNLLAMIIGEGDLSTKNVAKYIRSLPSMPLQIKFQKAVDNYAAKKSGTKSAKAPQADTFEWVDIDTDVAKVGRWTYPVQAQMRVDKADSDYYGFRRNLNRDGSGEWVPVDTDQLISQ